MIRARRLTRSACEPGISFQDTPNDARCRIAEFSNFQHSNPKSFQTLPKTSQNTQNRKNSQHEEPGILRIRKPVRYPAGIIKLREQTPRPSCSVFEQGIHCYDSRVASQDLLGLPRSGFYFLHAKPPGPEEALVLFSLSLSDSLSLSLIPLGQKLARRAGPTISCDTEPSGYICVPE